MSLKLCFSILILTCSLQSVATYGIEKVVYGRDNRVESQEYSDQRFVNASSSVAGMVWNKNLTESKNDPEIFNFKQLPMRLYYNVCKEEPFSEQITLPTCTAFLVGPDLLLTAGHCVDSETQCKQNTWIFDYVKGTTEIKKENMYSCKKIIDRKLVTSEDSVKDYALIQLDRAVEGRTPLRPRITGKVKRKTPIVVIGHPVGLPMKIADGAEVGRLRFRDILRPFRAFKKSLNYFIANTDTYMGNSGSPVLNENTGLVEGILIQGKKDFYYTSEDCLRTIHYADRAKNTDEKVFKILKVENLQKEITKSYKRRDKQF